jgi:hypothetical protein
VNRRLLAFLAVITGLLATPLAGCADPDVPASGDGDVPAGPFGPESYGGVYRATGLVLEDADHGPQLCRTVGLSMPPRCGGPDVIGWSWDGLEHSDVGGVRYGSFEIVGTYDGRRITLTSPPRPPAPARADPAPDLTSACPPPAGGWRVVDDALATDAALQEALAMVEAAPSGAGAWIDQNGGENDPRTLVLNARFTGDLAVHEARLRAVWGGALCVSAATRTTAELTRAQLELNSLPGMLSTGIDVVGNRVTVEVYVATDARRRELDARYGVGTVVLTGFLEPATPGG